MRVLRCARGSADPPKFTPSHFSAPRPRVSAADHVANKWTYNFAVNGLFFDFHDVAMKKTACSSRASTSAAPGAFLHTLLLATAALTVPACNSTVPLFDYGTPYSPAWLSSPLTGGGPGDAAAAPAPITRQQRAAPSQRLRRRLRKLLSSLTHGEKSAQRRTPPARPRLRRRRSSWWTGPVCG